jgi:hypothetical protein
MAFIKLWPPEDLTPLSTAEIIARLRDEFVVVHVDHEAGRDHVGDVIASTLRFSDSLPWKADRIAQLQSIQDVAVYVTFGDDLRLTAGCCLLPNEELFFGNPDAVDGEARSLVDRVAEVLGHSVDPG